MHSLSAYSSVVFCFLPQGAIERRVRRWACTVRAGDTECGRGREAMDLTRGDTHNEFKERCPRPRDSSLGCTPLWNSYVCAEGHLNKTVYSNNVYKSNKWQQPEGPSTGYWILKSDDKNKQSHLKKWAEDLKRHFFKEHTQMADQQLHEKELNFTNHQGNAN